MTLILASKSTARRDVLASAGVNFEVIVSGVDEDAIKQTHDPADASGLAMALADAKAQAVSRLYPDRWVLGADQTLAFDGGLISKARSGSEARERLTQMRGQTHHLHAGVALALGGEMRWCIVETAAMTMRPFSDAFLEQYLAAEGESILSSVGSYRLEGMGSQLFHTVKGDYFTVLGLPLWPVLHQLRAFGVLAT